jgi:hypothetical protein
MMSVRRSRRGGAADHESVGDELLIPRAIVDVVALVGSKQVRDRALSQGSAADESWGWDGRRGGWSPSARPRVSWSVEGAEFVEEAGQAVPHDVLT